MNTYHQADEITLVHSGQDYFDRLASLLDSARHTLHLQFYIFAADETGKRVGAALARAAARGVKVWVVADEFGSGRLLPPTFIKDLTKSGVQFRFFSQQASFLKWRFGRTLHHKIAVADGRQALVGGINIADKYRGYGSEAPWLDFAVYIRGDVCQYLEQLCGSIFKHHYFRKRDRPKETGLLLPENPTGLIRFRENDWLRGRNEIYRSYRQAIARAKGRMSMTASYFLPGRLFRRSLVRAVQRKRTVRILLTGPSDVPILPQAERYMQHWMLNKGIRVFIWEQSVMHGKTMVADDNWATVGSYNINHLSRFRSLELNVEILDPEFVRHFNTYMEDLLTKHCVEITRTPLRFSGWFDQMKSWLVYRVFFFLMRLFFAKKMF